MQLYEAECSRGEILRSEVRHLLIRRRAYEKRKRREEVHRIGVRTEIRSALGGELIEHPYSSSPKVEQRAHAGEAARIAALREMDLEGEEMTPADAANEFTE
jgi:hypothetical protein